MRKVTLLLFVALNATGLSLNAQEPPQSNARVEDEKAIKTLLETFTRAFNAGDARAAAETYTETAIVVDEEGARTEGRGAIGKQYASAFAASPGSTIAIQVESLRFLGAETAMEVGRSTIKPKEGAGTPEITKFTAVYVKSGGKWLQSAVRDEYAKDLTAHEHLMELEWLVGEWVNESRDANVDTTCQWSGDGNFLLREFTMKTRGKPVMTGSQRIGWDPVRKQFKTWIFDSEGGFGEGYWTRNGNQWVIKAEGVRQDGLPATATNIITKVSKDRATWQSVDRTLGTMTVPGVDEFTLVRKPPAPAK